MNTEFSTDTKDKIFFDDVETAMSLTSQHREWTDKKDRAAKEKEELLECLKGERGEKDVLLEKLNQFESVDALKNYLTNKKRVESFYVDQDGNPIEVALDFEGNKQREFEFKRDLLLHFKTTDVMIVNIEEALVELDKTVQDFSDKLRNIQLECSDEMLAYLSLQEEEINKLENPKAKEIGLHMLRYLRSGYNLAIFSETLDRYPSVTKNCIKDINNNRRIETIGKQYLTKKRKAGVPDSSSLVWLLSDTDDEGNYRMSVEEQVLLPEHYHMKDLFIFSIIRWFAMQSWSDPAVVKAHASIIYVIRRLLRGELEESVKESVTEAIVNYLKKFYED